MEWFTRQQVGGNELAIQSTEIHRLDFSNPKINQTATEDKPIHDWYRFVLSFPPHLVREYITRFGLNQDTVLLDPFCGTGTTLVEAKLNGIPSVGIERNPVAHFASETKVSWEVNTDELLNHARFIADTVIHELREEGIDDIGMTWHGDSERLETLPEEAEKLLLARSISPLPLHKTLKLLEVIRRYDDPRLVRYEKLALAKALVTTIGNLHFGPEVGVGKVKEDARVVFSWLGNVETMVNDINNKQAYRMVPSSVHLDDARNATRVLEPHSVDAVITSPPYPNEKDYTRTTRLESVILGFLRDKESLRNLKKGLVRSNTRGVYKGDSDDVWMERFPEIQRIADAIEQRRIELGKTSGFEKLYAKVTRLYFGGMARHLNELKTILRPGARLAYVVGDQASYFRILIRTGQLLADIAENLGYEVESIDLFRTRIATATKQQMREEVVVLRWRG